MDFSNREVTMYYKPEWKKDRNTYDLAKQLSEHVHDIDILKDTPTQSQLIEIVDKLGRKVTDLVDKDSTPYKEKFKNVDLDEMGWLKALQANPEMIFTPIVFLGNKGMLVDTPSRVLDLDPTHGFNDLKT